MTTYCVDCGAEISKRATRCKRCAAQAHSEAIKIAWRRGDYAGQSEAIKAAWKRGDLGDEEHLRKLSLAMKASWESGVLGKRYEQIYCIDCGAEISPRATRCQTCEQKRRWINEGYRSHILEVVKAAWAHGDIGDEDCRRKQSEAGKAAWARGDRDYLYDEECCLKRSKSLKAAWARGDFDSVFQSPTSIELQVAAALDIMGVEHQSQYRPDGYSRVFDEFAPPATLIEIHGDYFHSEEHFPGIQQRDTEKAQWAADNGFDLVTIWEHEIKEQGAWALVMERVAGIGPNDEEGE
ncbi:MAG: hypothetical protein ABIH46_07845 [Chloroflexota bacterium]